MTSLLHCTLQHRGVCGETGRARGVDGRDLGVDGRVSRVRGSVLPRVGGSAWRSNPRTWDGAGRA